MSGFYGLPSLFEMPSERALEAAAAVLGPLLLAFGWFLGKSLAAALIMAGIPEIVPLTNVPSIDCLMQYAHCLP